MPQEHYQPDGVRFIDLASGRRMLLVDDDEKAGFAGWICYWHCDGGWVSLRKATADDRLRIEAARDRACAALDNLIFKTTE